MTQWQPHVALSASCEGASLKARVQGVSTGGRIGGPAEKWHRNAGESKAGKCRKHAMQCRSLGVLLRRETSDTRALSDARESADSEGNRTVKILPMESPGGEAMMHVRGEQEIRNANQNVS